MTNKNKDKGDRFERELVALLNDKINSAEFKRNAGSGAIGTITHESLLTGDVRGTIDGLPFKFKGEAKARTGAKSLTVEKEWLDKIAREAEGDYSIPFLACKYLGARSGVKVFIALDIEVFAYLMNALVERQANLDRLSSEKTYGTD